MQDKIREPKKSDLRNIADDLPELHSIGLVIGSSGNMDNVKSENRKQNREEVYSESFYFQFCLCVEFLSQCKLRATTNRIRGNSYHLKHAAERWSRSTEHGPRYIPNGAMIAAMIYLDIPYEWDRQSLNVAIGVSDRCPLAGRNAK